MVLVILVMIMRDNRGLMVGSVDLIYVHLHRCCWEMVHVRLVQTIKDNLNLSLVGQMTVQIDMTGYSQLMELVKSVHHNYKQFLMKCGNEKSPVEKFIFVTNVKFN